MGTKVKEHKPMTEGEKIRAQRHRMKERAAILSISHLGPNKDGAMLYQVWGGEKPHIVRVMPNGQILCDCEGWKHARGNNCSHCMKYRLTYGDLRKDLKK